MNQTLEFLSGYPMLMLPNAPAMLARKKLNVAPKSYKNRHGDIVRLVNGLTESYHVYVLASRISASFGSSAVWDKAKKEVASSVIFHTYPVQTEVRVSLVFDGSTPYPIPPNFIPEEIVSVAVSNPQRDGYPMGLQFTFIDGRNENYFLQPDLLHFLRFEDGYQELTDFNIEYIGIACGPDGDSNVFKRAYAHEKVVEIQADFQQRYNNRTLYIFAYDPGYVIYSPGLVTGNELSKRLVVGGEHSHFEAMEASLIAYFQPLYNKEFKKFPKNRPHWLSGSIDSFDGPVLGIDRICVTLASDCSFHGPSPWKFGRFKSPTVGAQEVHFVEYKGL